MTDNEPTPDAETILAEFAAWVRRCRDRAETKLEGHMSQKELDAIDFAAQGALADIVSGRMSTIQHGLDWVTLSVPNAPLSPQIQIINVGMANSRKITGHTTAEPHTPVTLVATPLSRTCLIRIEIEGKTYGGNFTTQDVKSLLGYLP